VATGTVVVDGDTLVDGSTTNAEIETLEDTNISHPWQAPDGGRAGRASLWMKASKLGLCCGPTAPAVRSAIPCGLSGGTPRAAPLRQRERSRA